MSEHKTICILGRQPAIGRAELESMFGADNMVSFGDHALMAIPAEDIPFSRLGGTLKTARILAELPGLKWQHIEKYLAANIPKHLEHLPDGKFTLGLSVYGLNIDVGQINKTALKLKKIIKASGRAVRVVPNKEPALNTAQVLHNKLTRKGAWELIIVSDSQTAYLAQTFFVQDITAYAQRDQARPKRDSVVGMLPPKLAQVIINLAAANTKPERGTVVLDPFCGTGVILQEAALMGYGIFGTDIDPRMIKYTDENLQWLRTLATHIKVSPEDGKYYTLAVGDATSFKWSHGDIVASEVYLGPVLKGRADLPSIKKAQRDTNAIVASFLKNIRDQLSADARLCLAVPAWQNNDEFLHLPLLDQLADLMYNRVSFVHAGNEELIYHRPGQAVARELVILEKIKE